MEDTRHNGYIKSTSVDLPKHKAPPKDETLPEPLHVGKVPVIEVAVEKDLWWAIPRQISRRLYEKHQAGETDISYTGDWRDSRRNIFLNFEAGIQTDIDNRHRTMRVVWVDPFSSTPRWTGQFVSEQSCRGENAPVRTETFMSERDRGKVPVIEVASTYGMWWAFPQDLSQQLYEMYQEGNSTKCSYIWDSRDSSLGAWMPEKIHRFEIDFETGIQRDIDNNHCRTMRVVWVDPSSVIPRWTGQIPKPPQDFAIAYGHSALSSTNSGDTSLSEVVDIRT